MNVISKWNFGWQTRVIIYFFFSSSDIWDHSLFHFVCRSVEAQHNVGAKNFKNRFPMSLAWMLWFQSFGIIFYLHYLVNLHIFLVSSILLFRVTLNNINYVHLGRLGRYVNRFMFTVDMVRYLSLPISILFLHWY